MIHTVLFSNQQVSLWSYYQERLQKYVLGHMDLGNKLIKDLCFDALCVFIKVKSLLSLMKY